ncbi:hypothetical protein CSPX01_12777 [Colletotrichum filicis]|nr:hypothetical protein CSPX01_12777 [Colletotrichum filicis]
MNDTWSYARIDAQQSIDIAVNEKASHDLGGKDAFDTMNRVGEAEENTVGLVKLWQRKSIKQLPEILQLVGQPLLAPLASMFAANGFFPHDIDRLLESSFDGDIEDNDWPADFR